MQCVKTGQLLTHLQIPIDTSNVLLLSHLSNFRDGTILVREQQGLRFDIFRSYTSANDTVGAIKALRKYGPEEPQLYPAALAYFTSSPRILEEAGDELAAVLKKIDEDHLMAPLQVIQTLSTNAVATMGMVKKYLSDTIERERSEISYVSRPVPTYPKIVFVAHEQHSIEPASHPKLPLRNRRQAPRARRPSHQPRRLQPQTLFRLRREP